MSRFAYGFWRYGAGDEARARAMVVAAREAGITHLDTADVYGGGDGMNTAERLLGTLYRDSPSLFDGMEIATKAGVEFGSPYNSSPGYLTEAVDASLIALGTERIDLFYIHRPDVLAHPAEVAGVLDGLVGAGKIAKVGVSNHTTAQVAALTKHLKAPIVAHQVEISALHVTSILDGTLDQAMGDGMDVYAWSPLGGGALIEGGGERGERVRATLRPIAEAHGLSLPGAALAFLLGHPAGIRPIIGTGRPDRLSELVRAEQAQMSRAEWYNVLAASLGHDLP